MNRRQLRNRIGFCIGQNSVDGNPQDVAWAEDVLSWRFLSQQTDIDRNQIVLGLLEKLRRQATRWDAVDWLGQASTARKRGAANSGSADEEHFSPAADQWLLDLSRVIFLDHV